jgi:hypothetical protein
METELSIVILGAVFDFCALVSGEKMNGTGARINAAHSIRLERLPHHNILGISIILLRKVIIE